MGGSRHRVRPQAATALRRDLRQALRRLARLAHRQEQALYLVGGTVRDILLQREAVDLDLLSSGDAIRLARAYAARHGGVLTAHRRFGTAVLTLPGGGRVDLASPRRERYPAAGKLPQVVPARIAEDLGRRDFSVNAMAWRWGPAGGGGEILDPHGGGEDLRRRCIRALHADSFRDDPTRALRAVRLAARLGFRLERSTSGALRQARLDGLLAAVSPARLGREVCLLAMEEDWPLAVARSVRHGLLQAIHPGLQPPPLPVGRRLQRRLAARSPMEALPVVLASLGLEGAVTTASGALAALQMRGGALRQARRLLAQAHALRLALGRGSGAQITAARLARQALDVDDDALLLVAESAPQAATRGALRAFQRRRRRLQLHIAAADLLAAGVPRGPELRRRLDAARRAVLSGLPAGRRHEIGYALAGAAATAPAAGAGEV